MATLHTASKSFVTSLQQQPNGLWAAFIATMAVMCVMTRLLTRQRERVQTCTDLFEAKPPPAVPYCIPYLGHILHIAFDSDAFFEHLRRKYPSGAFSLTFFGSTHTIISKPGLQTFLDNQPIHIINSRPASKHLLRTIFGYPPSMASLTLVDKLDPDVRDQYKYLMSEGPLNNMAKRTADALLNNIADFVTLNSNKIKHVPWECAAKAELRESNSKEPVVEADLYELVRNFVAFTANGSLLGTDFVENFPEFWQAFWSFDDGVVLLAMDLPAWLPITKAVNARKARGIMLRYLEEFETAMETVCEGGDPGPQWANISNVSSIIKARVDNVWRKHDVSVKVRSSLELTLIWAMNANANPFIFWMLWRIYSNPDLLALVRKEIRPFITLKPPVVGIGTSFDSAARIEKIDLDGLLSECPFLKASYIECLRLDFNAWSFKAVNQDTVISARESKLEKFVLRAGTYAHGAHQLHHTDPAPYNNPQEWHAERHIKWSITEKGEKKAIANMGNMKPFGGGVFMCKGRQFAIREILLFSAAIISVYDIQPVGGKPWKLSKQRRSVGTAHAASSTRVWIKSRPLAPKFS